MFKTAALAALTFAAIALAPAPALAQKTESQNAAQATQNGRLAINGVNYYYEIHGKGEPLLLLHGGLGSIDMFGPALDKLAESREVIAVDLQGHGRTPLGERPFKLESMGDDMAALVAKLGRKQVDVLGYSMGGGVAFRMAAQHPQSVRRLAMVSTPFSDDGFYPGIRAQQNQLDAAMSPMMAQTPMYRSYVAVAPNKDEFPRLLDTIGNYMKQHYDWSADVAKLTMPTMLVYGDGDMFRPEHEIKFYQLLGGGLQDAGWQRETLSKNRLAILPDVTHYDIFASPRLIATVLPFLDGKSDAKSWAEQVEKSH